MAKLPGWMVMENMRVGDKTVTWDIRVRCWHPGFWLVMIRAAITALLSVRIKVKLCRQ